MAVIKQEIVSC